MEWSVKIGRFIGIDVYMHLTFLLLIGWVALMRWQNGRSVSAVSVGVLFILVIFFCVTLHEFGYALMARRYGVPTRDIILLPIGGVARLEKIPIQPIQELWVALAGPAVNAVIAVALFIWLKLTASWEPLESLYVTTGPFLERLMAVNLFMIVFNMIAAFPMDGGRVLCAVLATRQEYDRATRIAASIGRGTALVFGVAGFFYNPILVFIALFVWMGATQEAGMVQLESEISTIPVHKAMVSDFKTLSIQDSLNRAVELSLAGTQKDFPVVSDGVLEGMLRQTDLVKALPERDAQSSVLSITNKDMLTVDITEMLDAVGQIQCMRMPYLARRSRRRTRRPGDIGQSRRVGSHSGCCSPLAVKGNVYGPEHDRDRQSRGSIVGPFPYSLEPFVEGWTGCLGFSETLRLTVLPRAGGAVAPLQRCV